MFPYALEKKKTPPPAPTNKQTNNTPLIKKCFQVLCQLTNTELKTNKVARNGFLSSNFSPYKRVVYEPAFESYKSYQLWWPLIPGVQVD